ncbi:MAG: hypothetical protein CVV03_06445 [Firmicutes bacterium HGW-Firmicutes-8]|nr:MAG: hypothetical protein CVV03_06445 [Firmicutes bacterium HGW-Firmicutes-8]
MYLEEIKVSYGEGRYKIHISSVVTSDGISVTITGGEKPHVGGVALCVPRSGRSGGKISCDMWVSPVPGHKDTEVAVPVAEMVCLETGQTTAVVTGIHIDNAEEREIRVLVENSRQAALLLIEQIRQIVGD